MRTIYALCTAQCCETAKYVSVNILVHCSNSTYKHELFKIISTYKSKVDLIYAH